MGFRVIGLLGDSIANGYWDDCGGWFGRLQGKMSEECPLQYGFNNMAQDGDRICDVFHRLGGETLTRYIDTLLIAVGVNDIIRPYRADAPFDMSEHLREEYWCRVLDLASRAVNKTIVIGMLPVRENCYPDQDWSDKPIYTHNCDIEEYNALIEKLCNQRKVDFYNPYNNWQKYCLDNLYQDACHPNTLGHSKLAEEIFAYLKEKL